MALDSEELNDFLDSLSSRLTNIVAYSFTNAMKGVSLASVGTNLATSITQGLNTIDVAKILKNKLIDDPKITKVVTDLRKKIEDGLKDVNISASTTTTVQQVTQAPKPIQQSAQPLVKPVDTESFKNAGDLVREFVTLTQEANKKTEISSKLYNDLLDIATRLVATKRMEKDAVDEIMASYQKKVKPSEVSVDARLGSVDTSALNNIKADIEPTINMSSIESSLSKFLKNLGNMLNRAFNLDQVSASGKKVINNLTSYKPKPLYDIDNKAESIVDYIKSKYDDLVESNTSLLSIQKLLNRENASQLDLITSRVDIENDLQQVLTSTNGVEILQNLGKQLGLSENQLKNEQNLSRIIANRIVDLEKENQLRTDIVNATDDYNKAVRQAKEDVRIKGLLLQVNLTEDEVAQKARLLSIENERNGLGADLTAEQIETLKNDNKHLRHLREEVELIEHVAEYQKEVNQELEKYTKKWSKIKATTEAIFNNKAFAKGVLFAGLIAGAEKLHHTMHDFMEVGMTAGEGIAAAFKSTDLYSIMGLSKSSDVVKTIASQYGNLNTLTKEQVSQVGYMAASYGLAGDEALNLTMAISRLPGESRDTAVNFKKTAESVGKMKGVMPSQIMKEMAKNADKIAIYSKGGAEGFAKAAASAKKMGIELSNILSAARKTLDFESSINAQMEASVLLGKEINLDRLREATLSGDANAILREQQNLIKQAGGLDKMNLLQKEKLAEVMGLTVDEMQRMNDEAQTQNKYFGEQASTFENIIGYTLKYGSGLVSGFSNLMPILVSMSALMSLMGAKSIPQMVMGVYSMVKGLAVGVLQAGLLLVKMIALGTASIFGKGGAAKNFLFGDKGIGGSIKGLFGKKTGTSLTPEAPPKVGAGPVDQASSVSKINASSLLKGAAAMLVAAAAIYVFAKAVQELEKVKDWKSVAIGLGLFAVSMAVTAAILSLAGPEIAIASLALIPFGLALMMFAKAIAIAAPAITMLGTAFGSFIEKVSKNMGGFIAVALGLPLLAAGIVALAASVFFVLPAVGVLTVLGAGIAVFGRLVKVAAPGIESLAKSLSALSTVKLSNLIGIGPALSSLVPGIKSLSDASTNIMMAAFSLGTLGTVTLLLSQGSSYASGAVKQLADSLYQLTAIDTKLLQAVSNELIRIAVAAKILAEATPMLFKTSVAMVRLGGALMIFSVGANQAALAIKKLQPLLKTLIADLTKLVQLTKPLIVLTSVLYSLAKSVVLFGLASLFAAPMVKFLANSMYSLGIGMIIVAKNTDKVKDFIIAVAAAGGGLLKAGLGISVLSIGLIALAGASIISFLPLKLLSYNLNNIKESISGIAVNAQAFTNALQTLSAIDDSKLKRVGDSLASIAKSFVIMGKASSLITPALEKLAIPVAQTPGEVNTQSTLKFQPANIQQATATQNITQTNSVKKESNEELKALSSELRALIAVLKAGSVINMDGQKVADIVQRRTRTFNFTT